MIDNYVCVDIETTGLSKDKDSIVEIGAIKVVDGKKCDLLEYLSQRAVISEVFCDGVG